MLKFPNKQSICLWFDRQAEQMGKHFTATFNDAKKLKETLNKS